VKDTFCKLPSLNSFTCSRFYEFNLRMTSVKHPVVCAKIMENKLKFQRFKIP
jgi:hypothetical protein